MKFLTILLVSFVLAISTALCQTGRVELRADMTGVGKGKTVFKTRGSQSELQWEGERLPRNQTFTLVIGTWSAEVTTNALGRGRLSLRFSAANRPNIQAGMLATLYDFENEVVNEGPFVRRR